MKKNAQRDGAQTRLRNGVATDEDQRSMHAQLVTTTSKLGVALKQIAALEARRMPVMIKISVDAACAEARFCFAVDSSPAKKKDWLDKHDLFVTDGRAFALVNTVDRVFYMDAITGSLYALGECLTGTGRTGFRRNRVLAEKILMAAGQGEVTEEGDSDDDGDE